MLGPETARLQVTLTSPPARELIHSKETAFQQNELYSAHFICYIPLLN